MKESLMSQEENQDVPEKKVGFIKRFWKGLTFNRLFWAVYIISGSVVLYRDFELINYFIDSPHSIPAFFPQYVIYSGLTLSFLIVLRLKKPELAERILSNIYLRIVAFFSCLLFVAHYHGITSLFLYELSENGKLILTGLLFLAAVFLIWGKPKVVVGALKSSYFWFWLFVFTVSLYLLFRIGSFSFIYSYWIYFFGAGLVLVSIYLIWKIPLWLNSDLSGNEGRQLSAFERREKELKLIDDSRKTVATIVGGLFVVVGAIFTYSNYQLAFEGQVTERFSKSVALLKEPDVSVRTGGLFALERIAKDSPKDHPTIMETFAAYIREKSREGLVAFVKEKAEKSKKTYEQIEKDPNTIKEFAERPSNTDVVTALEIIGRRNAANDKEGFKFDLRGANAQEAKLPGASLVAADFSKANLSEADFEGALLRRANFREATLFKARMSRAVLTSVNMNGAYLSGAELVSADLSAADLSDADMTYTDLTRAILREANLTGVYLRYARLSFADLSGANLTGADLAYVDLPGTNLTGADLTYANLSGVILRETADLTFELLSVAIIDEDTVLPDELLDRRNELLKLSEINRQKLLEETERRNKYFGNRKSKITPAFRSKTLIRVRKIL
jgi:uncharacterized protein YjbI with pentapeptide repeats